MLPSRPSPFRAFVSLFFFALGRHAKVRQLGYVAFGLLALLTAIVAVISQSPAGWRLEKRVRTVASPKAAEPPDNVMKMTYEEYGRERLPFYQAFPGSPTQFAIKAIAFAPYWSMINAAADAEHRRYLDDWAFLSYSRWVVFALFLAFLMPLFALAFASGSIGSERESRTLIWLTTRPLPRWAIYLAKLLATMPWVLGISAIGFGALCLAGGHLGQRAIGIYWPAVLAAAVAFTCLFHLVGAVFRRPAVIGLVYIFFFETLVSNLPGSMKQLSLSYYVRSLFYNATAAEIATVQPESVDVYAPVDNPTAWAMLLGVAVVLTAMGMFLFGRQEPKDET
jgi:ABC-type transport system involved in multi-copper enzyme maturation permease subunit